MGDGRLQFRLGVALTSLIASGAFAQNAQDLGPPPAATNSADIAQPDQLGTATEGFRDIVITARRRTELLQDVPVAVQAFSQDSLDALGVTRTEDLVNVTPALRISPSSGGRATPGYEIRGIFAREAVVTQDAPVAVYINEVYAARPFGTNQSLIDMENVQVLLGPQGTLFGRNATAGAILLNSRRPAFRVEGELGVSVGNYDYRSFQGIINLPLSDRLALRLVAASTRRDGYVKDIEDGQRYGDQDNFVARASLRWRPSSTIENDFIFDHFRSRENGTPFVLGTVRPEGTVATRFPQFLEYLADQQDRGPFRYDIDLAQFEDIDANGITNITTIDLSDTFSIVNIFGYRWNKADSAIDLDGTPVQAFHSSPRQESDQYSNELQLRGKAFGGALDYVVGGYFFKESGSYFVSTITNLTTPQQEPGPTSTNPSVTFTEGSNESYSIFGQGSLQIGAIPGLTLTAGARYTRDERSARYESFVGTPPRCRIAGATPDGPCVLVPPDATFERPTWTIGLDYQFDRDKLIYVAHRRGYRSGGFNPRAVSPLQAIPFKPETISDIEVGFKADWDLGGIDLRTNFAAYYSWYDEIQRTVAALAGSPPVITTTIVNAAEARIRGFEANVGIEPVRGVSLTGFWSYVDAIHTRFDIVPSAGNVGRQCGDIIISPDQVGTNIQCPNVPFGNPKHSAGVAINLVPIDSPHQGRLSFTANYNYQSSFFTGLQLPLFDPEDELPPRNLVNLSLDWANVMGSRFSLHAFVRNLFNDRYELTRQSVATLLGFTSFVPGEPRMFGIGARYSFGGD